MSDIALRKLEGSTKPQIIVIPGPVFSIVSFRFQTLVKYLGVLNATKYNIDITTYRRNTILQKGIDVKLDVKVSSLDLMRGLSMYLNKGREDKQQSLGPPSL